VAAQPAASSQPQHGSMQGLHVRFIDPRASSRQRFRRTGAEMRVQANRNADQNAPQDLAIWRPIQQPCSHSSHGWLQRRPGREQGAGTGRLAGWLAATTALPGAVR
jgi:hypothetical protein